MKSSERPLSGGRIALGLVSFVGGLALLGGVAIGVAAGVGAVLHATNPPVTNATSSSPSGTATVRLVVKDVPTPDGEQPAFIGPNGVGAKVLFSATVDRTTEVTVVNESPVPHIFTASALGVSTLQIPADSTVHFSIDPKHTGEVSWECQFPCGNWVMAESGYMLGSIKVT